MNERIKELATKAGYKDFDYAIIAHKFAELIVEECRAVVTEVYRTTPLELCGPLLTVDAKIAEHFYGVTESKGWVCTKCGVDRTKDVCPLGHTAAITGECPMSLEAQ